MIPYKPKTSEAAERRLEGAGGFLIFENDDLLLDDAPTDAVE